MLFSGSGMTEMLVKSNSVGDSMRKIEEFEFF